MNLLGEIEERDLEDVEIGVYEQYLALGIFVDSGADRTCIVNLDQLLAKIARQHTAALLEALDDLVREKLIEKSLNLIPGKDTGNVSFIFPVTAYTKGLTKEPANGSS